MANMSTETIMAFIFGVTFVVTLIVLAVRFPNPTPFQYNVFRTVLALAAAGVGALIPGLLNVELSRAAGLLVRAGGALAVFVLTFFFNPAKLLAHGEGESSGPPVPLRLPDGTPLREDQRAAFNEVWRSLIALETAGEGLWRHVSDHTLATFADRLHEATHSVARHALFFSEADYESLERLLEAGDLYFGGKESLLSMRNGFRRASRGEHDLRVNDRIRQQVRQNKRWLTRYRNLLRELRTSLSTQIAQSA